MVDIYQQHEAAFAQVSAYVILKDGERVATVAFKFPRDGAGRLWAYVHWIGNEMVRGHAGGYGYDKRTAAVVSAANKYMVQEAKAAEAIGDHSSYLREPVKRAFWEAIVKDGGHTWDSALRDAGFTVLQAI